MTNRLLQLVMALTFGALIAGCEQEGPMERAGKVLDEAVEDTGEAIEDAHEKVEDAIEDQQKK